MIDNYIRPTQTYTERLDEDDIQDKLIDYIQVDNIANVKLNSHLRYFILEIDDKGNTNKKFRMGGFLKNNDNSTTYVMLSNGTKSWSVQTKNAIFYKKLTINEIKEDYENKLNELKYINKKLLKQNNKLKEYIQKIYNK
jgi:hypothetical protein